MGQKGQIERHLREMAAIHKTMMSFVISCLEVDTGGRAWAEDDSPKSFRSLAKRRSWPVKRGCLLKRT